MEAQASFENRADNGNLSNIDTLNGEFPYSCGLPSALLDIPVGVRCPMPANSSGSSLRCNGESDCPSTVESCCEPGENCNEGTLGCCHRFDIQ